MPETNYALQRDLETVSRSVERLEERLLDMASQSAATVATVKAMQDQFTRDSQRVCNDVQSVRSDLSAGIAGIHKRLNELGKTGHEVPWKLLAFAVPIGTGILLTLVNLLMK